MICGGASHGKITAQCTFIFSISFISRALIGFFRAALAALIRDNVAESMSLLLVCIASAGIPVDFGCQRLVGHILEETVL